MIVAVDLDAIFERAPGLAARVRAAVGEDAAPDAIVDAARAELARMSEAERVAVLDAHPRIGAPRASLSALSRREQGAPADDATARELAKLNDDYERRFGFRFVVWVNGRDQAEIARILVERVARDRAGELAKGIEEFLAIARDRMRPRA